MRGIREKKWTGAARRLLYEELVAQFGPYDNWQSGHLPGNGRDVEYHRFLKAIAGVIGASSVKAVEQQIRFAMPVKRKARWSQSHTYNAVLNMAAALQAGFIGHRHLPEIVATKSKGRGRRRGTVRVDVIENGDLPNFYELGRRQWRNQ